MSLHTISVDEALAALPGFPSLRGPRVRLRAPAQADADALFALFADPEVTRYWSRKPMRVRDEAEGLLAEMRESFAERSTLPWIITSHRAVVGTCTLFDFDGRRRSAEIGYALLPPHWGQGLAGEAVALVVDWAFDRLRLQRIEASIDPQNTRSARLLQRLGFHREGRFVGRRALGDPKRRADVFALSADGWHADRR